MEHKIIFAGFGGQGVISMGNLIAYAAMAEDKNVTFYPAYGIAMRGGTANCSVIVSDESIASPVIAYPTVLVAMNEQSFDFFIGRVQKDGLILVNSSLVKKAPERKDIRSCYVPVNDIAEGMGNGKMANMAMIGALLGKTNVLAMETIFKTMKKTFPEKLHKVLGINQKAIEKGYEAALAS